MKIKTTAIKTTTTQNKILDRIIDGSTILNRKQAFDAVFAMCDTQLKASGF